MDTPKIDPSLPTYADELRKAAAAYAQKFNAIEGIRRISNSVEPHDADAIEKVMRDLLREGALTGQPHQLSTWGACLCMKPSTVKTFHSRGKLPRGFKVGRNTYGTDISLKAYTLFFFYSLPKRKP